jgi:hypothetical protein
MGSPSLLDEEQRKHVLQSFQPVDAPRGQNVFRPVSPSLVEMLNLSPEASPCSSPSLGVIHPDALKRSEALKRKREEIKMTVAICKRASRMARPAEPSQDTLAEMNDVLETSVQSLYGAGLRLFSHVEQRAFSTPSNSGGKGPSVRVETGNSDRDASAQAKANHMMSIHVRSLENDSGEPSWLVDATNSCPKVYGRLAASAIKNNAVNSSVTNREKTQGAANQVRV